MAPRPQAGVAAGGAQGATEVPKTDSTNEDREADQTEADSTNEDREADQTEANNNPQHVTVPLLDNSEADPTEDAINQPQHVTSSCENPDHKGAFEEANYGSTRQEHLTSTDKDCEAGQTKEANNQPQHVTSYCENPDHKGAFEEASYGTTLQESATFTDKDCEAGQTKEANNEPPHVTACQVLKNHKWKIIFLFLAAFSIVPFFIGYGIKHCGRPPRDWIWYNNVGYYYSEEMLDWSSSKRFCENEGAMLAVLKDDIIRKNVIRFKADGDDRWYGYYKMDDEWKWLNKSSLDDESE